MNVKWLLRLYPPLWRQRYQEEMLALLEEHHVTWRTRIDLLLGALDAWMHPQSTGPRRLSSAERALRVRRAHSTVFWAFPGFVVGFLLFLDNLDDDFQAWNHAHAMLSRWREGTEAKLANGFIAFLTTGLLLAFLLIHEAGQKRPKWRLWLAPGCILIPVALYLLRIQIPLPPPSVLPFVLTSFPLVIAARLSRSNVSPKLLRYALAPVAFTVASMAAHALFFTGWAVLVWNVSTQAVPHPARVGDSPLLLALFGGSWHARLVVGILWLACMTGWAIRSFVRALSALTRRELPAG